MPISSVASYIPTMQEFATHWNAVNNALGGVPLILKNGYAVATFLKNRTSVQNAIIATESTSNAREVAAANRDAKKLVILPRLAQFRATVKYELDGSVYVSALPLVPDIKRAEGIFLRPFDDMMTLWERIDNTVSIAGFTPPLTLLGGYNITDFLTDTTDLRQAYAAVNTADTDARIARKQRDAILPPARTRLLQYRTAVLAKFGPDSPLTLSLPKYTPDAGSTPDSVNLSAVWEPALGKARLAWEASANPKLSHYEVRQSGGSTYKTADEFAVATVAKTDTQLLTAAGIGVPGAVNCFKVYVVTQDGNERGSNTAKVSRPVS